MRADFRAKLARDAFRDNAATIVGHQHANDAKNADHEVHAEAKNADHRRENDLNLLGQKSGSVESVIAGSAMASAKAQEAIHDKAEKEAKQQAEDLFFLSLLQKDIEALGREIDFLEDQARKLEVTIDAMLSGRMGLGDALEEDHVQRAIEKWEARHGRSFDPNAADAEELLLAIMEEQKQIDRGTVVHLKQRRSELSDAVDEARIRIADGEEPQAVHAEYETRFGDVYSTHEAMTFGANEVEELAKHAWGGQDEHSDTAVDSDDDVAMNDDAFSGLGSALDAASEEMNSDFRSASAELVGGKSPEPTQNPAPKA
ncbi:MAG: hypothetical protein AAFV45_12750 [Pseudomonadota bacterium]